MSGATSHGCLRLRYFRVISLGKWALRRDIHWHGLRVWWVVQTVDEDRPRGLSFNPALPSLLRLREASLSSSLLNQQLFDTATYLLGRSRCTTQQYCEVLI